MESESISPCSTSPDLRRFAPFYTIFSWIFPPGACWRECVSACGHAECHWVLEIFAAGGVALIEMGDELTYELRLLINHPV